MFENLLNNVPIVPSDNQGRQDGLTEEVGGLEYTEVLSGRNIHERGKLSEKARLKERDINKSRVNKQFHLRWSGMIEGMDLEMAFPGFEDDFDSPTHPVDPAHRRGVPDVLRNVGEKDLPSEKSQTGFIGIEPFVSTVEKFSPSFGGNMLRDRNGHYPDGESCFTSGKEFLVKNTVFFQASEHIKAFAGVVEEGYFVGIATQVESFFLTDGSEDTKGRVAQVSDHQISISDNIQDGRRGALIVASMRGELK
jgi:hypothetical protein